MPRLTKRTLDAAKPDPMKDTFIWCSATPGFGARVYPSGKMVFIAQVRIGRGQRRVKIGPFGAYTVDQARERADQIIRAAAEGRDPQREKQERREALTVAELCDLYMEAAKGGRVLTRFGQPKKASTLAIDAGRIEQHIKPLIGRMIARDVKAVDIQRMADGIADGKTARTVKSAKMRGKAVVTGGAVTAGRVVELLGGIWTWAAKREFVPPGSITRGVDRTKAQPKARMLSPDELKALGAAIRAAKQKSPMAALAAHLIALTAMRREEAVRLTWAEFDRAGSCVHLDDSKTGRSTRALGAPAVAILEARGARKQHSVHVFPNSRGDGPADLKKGIAAIFDAAGLPDIRSHALRRTFASIGDELGFSEPTIGTLLGHASRSVTAKHYIRRPDTALVAAATRIAEQIEMLLGEQPGGELKILDRPSRPDAAG
jgi:integrase